MELGLNRSRFLGIGLEYADFREYQESDDVKYVDWTLSARSLDTATGEYKLYTKVFHVEKMKNIIFVADLTDSMLIEEKLAALFYISSLLLELSHRLSDRISLVTLTHGPRVYRALRGREAIRVLENIICREREARGSTRINEIIDILRAYTGKNTAITIITDYAHEIEEFAALTRLKRAMMIPAAVYLIFQRWEIEQPVDNATATLIDPETLTPITDRLEEIYKAIKAHVSHVQALLSAARINHLPVQGISDAKARTVKIAETYLKTRQMHVASI
jgi:uncharacterized protein (DUF58 family)